MRLFARFYKGGEIPTLPNDWPKPATLAERYNGASALRGSALSIFEDTAYRLSDAEREFMAVANEAAEEIDRLSVLREAATADAETARESARSILDLTRGYRND